MSIFGWGKVVEKGLDLIDSVYTSDVEAIEAKSKAKVDLMKAYAPFRVAQRYIAFIFVYLYVLFIVAGSLIILFGERAETLARFHEALNFANEMYLGVITLAIIGFYFGGGALESFLRGKKNGT